MCRVIDPLPPYFDNVQLCVQYNNFLFFHIPKKQLVSFLPNRCRVHCHIVTCFLNSPHVPQMSHTCRCCVTDIFLHVLCPLKSPDNSSTEILILQYKARNITKNKQSNLHCCFIAIRYLFLQFIGTLQFWFQKTNETTTELLHTTLK